MKTEIAAEWLTKVVDLSAGDNTVNSGPCLLRIVYINTVFSAHAVTLDDNGVAIFTIPLLSGAGLVKEFGDVRFETDLVVNVNPAATGNITVIYKPNHEGFSGEGA